MCWSCLVPRCVYETTSFGDCKGQLPQRGVEVLSVVDPRLSPRLTISTILQRKVMDELLLFLLLLLLPYGCSAAKEASQKNLSSKSNAKQPTLFIICIFGSLHIRLQSYFPIELPFLLLSVMSFIVRAHHSQEEEATWWPHPPHHNSSMYLGNF